MMRRGVIANAAHRIVSQCPRSVDTVVAVIVEFIYKLKKKEKIQNK